MAELGLFDQVYNPDVLSCLANLSNDEVFTPPEVANAMLDMLPQELFRNPDTTFLDPACKSGIFLREIAKRLLVGLEPQIPDLQERIDHIMHKQLFGIAITELTSLLVRRSVYCSKYPNGDYSVSRFEDAQGNIRFKRVPHTWQDGKCIYCGANQSQYDRGDILETHAYEWIHIVKPEDVFNMKFDVIISNPPYQLSTSDQSKQAKPLYPYFIQQAKKLNPRFLTMIIPSRWFAGGMGLDDFRDEMMSDRHIRHLVDYANAKECFPQNSISGGVCYFLRDREYNGICEFINVNAGKRTSMNRPLNEFPILVRYNEAVSIIHKIKSKHEADFADIISSLMPFGLNTNYRGRDKREYEDDLTLYASNGITYVRPREINKGQDLIYKFKILMSKTGAEHAGEPGKDGMFRVLTSSMKILKPGEICTHSYFVIGRFDDESTANNVLTYLQTKFLRFLVLLAMSSINVSKLVFPFVPMQDFSKQWSDAELYRKYELSEQEITLIESMIKPMDTIGGES